MTGGGGGESTPFHHEFMAGTVGGTALVIVGHPMDTIKVRLQTQAQELAASQAGRSLTDTSQLRFQGPVQCFVQTLRNEGLRGLYKGVQSPLTGVPLQYMVSFGFWGLARKVLHTGEQGSEQALWKTFVAGGMSGAVSATVTAPVEGLKVKMQVQYAQPAGKKRLYTSFFDCAVKTVRHEGVRNGLFKGLAVTAARDLPGSAIWYGSYDAWKRGFTTMFPGHDMLGAALSGGLAGVTAWSALYPVDGIKSRIQTAPAGTYKGIIDCFRHVIRTEGARSLYKGLSPALMRCIPADAACFVAFEYTMKLIKERA